jgi:hypothetical protein
MAINSLSTGWRPGVCTSSTRPTAPYEGQVIYETDTDLSYVWGGAAWQQVSGGTAVGNSGLVFVASSTVGAGVTTHAVSNCFSSLYDNYKITWAGGVGTNPVAVSMQLGASTTGYYQGLQYVTYSTGAVSSISTNNGSSWQYAGEASPSMCAIDLDLFNPFLAKFSTIFGGYSGTVGGSISGYHGVATSYTGFSIIVAGNTITGGTVTVYGYRK